MPKVSVVIPTYDRIRLLERAVESVFAQSFRDFEILVIQNGPSRNAETFALGLQKQGRSVRYLHVSKAGIASARNEGVRNAAGEYIAFLDDDDRWFPEKLATQIPLFEADPETGMIASRARVINEKSEETGFRPEVRQPCDYRALLLKDCYRLIGSMSGVVIRKRCFEAVGIFNTRYAVSEDVDLYLRLARRYKIQTLEGPLFYYHWHGENTSRDYRQGWLEVVKILKTQKPAPELGVTREVLKEAVLRYPKMLYQEAVESLEKKDFKTAKTRFLQAVSAKPLIGLSVSWGRYKNPVYRLIRPYFAIVYCVLKSLGRSR